MKTMRADALRNRAQIVDAARILFITRGPDTPMEDIARAAGVGVGTLYRRFPDRDSLIIAVGQDVVGRLTEMLHAAREAESDAWHALGRYLREWAEIRLGLLYDALCHGMPPAVRADQDLARARDDWADLLDELLRDAKTEGALRQDVDLVDVATFMNLLIQMEPGGTPDKLLDVMIDGLRGP
ncbi:TetR/AcrR family transcriptional regulator [Actinocrispum wychmicini]|uniref:TetR family transcriptional regulator n=1 Tax=Actinocrispum wychmicini TaxID=1213861 RepID=A0A4R2J7S4_9PSEU|nr:TetR/AcrR family transcriptional regulator [Actinocrispum wychmicini]TCO53702.1 TetR family transcriptional regulator [Actinocrispum wychmicini]